MFYHCDVPCSKRKYLFIALLLFIVSIDKLHRPFLNLGSGTGTGTMTGGTGTGTGGTGTMTGGTGGTGGSFTFTSKS